MASPTSSAASVDLSRASIIDDAVEKFKRRLTKSEFEDFKKTTYQSLIDTLDKIQGEQEQFKTMVNMARIERFLEAVRQLGNIVEVFLNVSPFVCFVWGPIKFLLQTTNNHVESLEAFLDAWEAIGEQLPLVEEYRSLLKRNKDSKTALERIYVDLLEFHQDAIRACTGPGWKKLFRAVWKHHGSRMQRAVARMARHRQLIESLAHHTHIQETQDFITREEEHFNATRLHLETQSTQSQEHLRIIEEHLQTLHEQHEKYLKDIAEIDERSKKQTSEEEGRKRIAVASWLAAVNPQGTHDSLCAERAKHPDTGHWILENEIIQNWKDSEHPESPILWLNGIPGAGKTVLASIVIEACKWSEHFSTTYFYCKEGDQERSSALAVFKSLLNQMVAQHPRLMLHCHEKQLSTAEPSLRTPSIAKALLTTCCEETPHQYIIVDGLDECEPSERKEVLKFFIKTADSCEAQDPGKCRILFVSQDTHDIRKAVMDGKTKAKIFDLRPETNRNDISVFVRDWIGKIQEKHEINEMQQDYICTSTVTNARGMFLFAKLVCSHFYAQPTKGRLIAEISDSRKFPRQLQEAYQTIMKRIQRDSAPEEWEEAKKLLGWLVCAKRPLSWIEIQVAISMNHRTQTVDFDEGRLRVNIQEICGSLVQILPGNRIELVHSTAKIHLLANSSSGIDEAAVECDLSTLCLNYLTWECFDGAKDVTQERIRQLATLGNLAFQDYAVAKWFHHVNAFIRLGSTLLDDGRSHAGLREFSQTLDYFLERFKEEKWGDQIVSASRTACEKYQEYDFYENLLAVASHIYRHQEKGFEARNEISIKGLSEALMRNRKFLENPPEDLSGQEMERLTEFYGENRFKCRKITCVFFYEGFHQAKIRDKHVNRHDRPFHCPDETCLYYESGFGSNKEMDNHLRGYHPERVELSTEFKSTMKKPVSSRWNCTICGKNFTRNFHLKNHYRSHNGERPHACPECGRAFTRLNDRKRHQKLHERR